MRHTAVAAMSGGMGHNLGGAVATVSAVVVEGIVGEVGPFAEREVAAGKGRWYSWAEEQNA